MPFNENIGVFFKLNEFCDKAVCHARGLMFNCIYDEPFYDAEGIDEVLPQVTCETAVIESLEIGDLIEVKAANYKIRSEEQDGTGISILYLDKV